MTQVQWKVTSIVTANPLIGHGSIVAAGKSEFPFVVSLSLEVGGRSHFCTGSLITREHVLTAAHCFQSIGRPRNVRTLIGTNDLNNGGTKYHVSQFDKWITYNDWAKNNDYPTLYECNDIAIVTLNHQVEENIPLPKLSADKDEKHYKKTAVTVGWGDMSGGVQPNLLQKASLKIMDKTECEDTLEKLGYARTELLLSEICTTANPRVLLGQGDSGGPLLINGNEIIGVNQAICPKDQEDNPNAYNINSSIDFYRSFISSVTNMVL